jgi:hypothetical protein
MLAKSPNRKRTMEYLAASGATAISIIEIDGVCTFRVGTKIDPRAVSVQWITEANARAGRPAGPPGCRQEPGRRHGDEGTGAGHR